jgi:thioredoxin reductase
MSRRDIVVVGAGIIGVACALQLARQGRQVQGVSLANLARSGHLGGRHELVAGGQDGDAEIDQFSPPQSPASRFSHDGNCPNIPTVIAFSRSRGPFTCTRVFCIRPNRR